MVGAISLTELLSSKQAPPTSDDEQNTCNSILEVSAMRDPVVMSYLISVEEQNVEYSSRFGLQAASGDFWTADHRKILLKRWSKELRELNIAIGQHALMAGDAVLGDWGTALETPDTLTDDQVEVLKNDQVLGVNAARYWLWHRDEAASRLDGVPSVETQAGFAFAYHACDAEFLSLSAARPSNVFGWTDKVRNALSPDGRLPDTEKSGPCPTNAGRDVKSDSRWCATFGRVGCLELPTPAENAGYLLRHTSNLDTLLKARERLLTLIESTNLFADDFKSEARRLQLLEALAIEWKVENVRPKAPSVPSAKKPLKRAA